MSALQTDVHTNKTTRANKHFLWGVVFLFAQNKENLMIFHKSRDFLDCEAL
jgi:hypothetical protein